MRPFLIFWSMIIISSLSAQENNFALPIKGFKNLIIRVDTSSFSSQKNLILHAQKEHLAFQYFHNEEVLRGELYIENPSINKITLLPSQDFEIIDLMELVNDSYYRFKVRMKDLANTSQLAFTFRVVHRDSLVKTFEIPLLPYNQTTATYYPIKDLYLGEAMEFKIITNQVENLQLDGLRKSKENFFYRVYKENNEAVIMIEPTRKGLQNLSIVLKTKKPFIDDKGNLSYSLPPITHQFNIKESRLSFLKINANDIEIDPENRNGVEVQIDNDRKLEVGKTYRIESKEAKGSPLVAEFFTERVLSNDKIVSFFRPFYTHKTSDGYLYVKDGDKPIFITNIDIVPLTKVEKVSIRRFGGEFTASRDIKPGEEFYLKIEGTSLNKAKFSFDDLEIISIDTLNKLDNVQSFKLRVPLYVSKRKQEIFIGGKSTGIELNVREHQKTRELDFILIDYGYDSKPFNSITQPILFPKTIKDVILSFDRDKIDRGDILYGRQFITISVRMEDKNGALLETRTIGNFEICPGENSPRYMFYPKGKCQLDNISINNFISRKTHRMEEWGKIEIKIHHVGKEYEDDGYSHTVVIYNQKRVTFDIDVSIPAGLITQKIGANEGLSPFVGGLGLAMLAQLSFYKKDEIQKSLPIRVGVGFVAPNVLNFSDNAQRDLGLVIISSVYPIRRSGKFRFPLHIGFGYFLQEKKPFFLVGPGLGFRF